MIPFFSVVINCYNGERYLKETIKSVINQSFVNWELILFDNRSTDNTKQIFDSFDDKRLKYILSEKHVFLGEARNLAVKNCNGKWLSFLDCDDYWDINRLKFQYKFIVSNINRNLGLVYSKTRIVNNDINQSMFSNIVINRMAKNKNYSGKIFNKLLLKNFIPFCSATFLKDAFIKLNGVNPSFKVAEDYEIILKISRLYEILYIPKSISYYRIHANNFSNTNFHLGYLESILILKRYLPHPFAAYKILEYLLKYIFVKINMILKNN